MPRIVQRRLPLISLLIPGPGVRKVTYRFVSKNVVVKSRIPHTYIKKEEKSYSVKITISLFVGSRFGKFLYRNNDFPLLPTLLPLPRVGIVRDESLRYWTVRVPGNDCHFLPYGG